MILSAGVLVGAPDVGFLAMAAWSVVSVGAQVLRSLQAVGAKLSGRPVENWLS